jgi:hypothetical protein
LTAINGLAPAFDAPNAPNIAVAARVEAAMPGADPLIAVWAAIEDALDDVHPRWREELGGEEWDKIKGA